MGFQFVLGDAESTITIRITELTFFFTVQHTTCLNLPLSDRGDVMRQKWRTKTYPRSPERSLQSAVIIELNSVILFREAGGILM